MRVIGLAVRPTMGGGWELRLKAPGGAVSRAQASPRAVAQVRRAVAGLPDAADDVEDEDWRHAETRVGRALTGVLTGSGLSAGWEDALQAARAADVPLVVAVDTGGSLGWVPWELLAVSRSGVPLETAGMGAVIRRVRDAPPLRDLPDGPVTASLDTLGEETALTMVHDAVAHACRRRNVSLATLPGEGPSLRAVVSGAAHRRAVSSLFTDPADPDRWERALARAELLWVAVCAGEPELGRQLLHLPERAVRAGATATVASGSRMPPQAAGLFGQAMHHAILTGETLLTAVVAGRAVLREAGLSHPDARWWRPRLHVGHIRAVRRAPCPRTAHPLGWPTPHPRAGELVRRALAYAETDGFLGVEHLAEALVDQDVPGLDPLREALRGGRRAWQRRLAALDRHPMREVRPRMTPRVARVAEALRGGFTAQQLFAHLLAEPWAWARWLEGAPIGPRPPGIHDGAGVPAIALEILGGPEDGRRLELHAGDVLGRHSSRRTCDQPLYADATRIDPAMSRRHLRWLDQGWIQLLQPALRLHGRDGVTERPVGPMPLHAGDLVELTPSTCLVGLGPAPRPAVAPSRRVRTQPTLP